MDSTSEDCSGGSFRDNMLQVDMKTALGFPHTGDLHWWLKLGL